MTPEEKLCSRWWRLGHSAWLLISILSVGIFTWVGFLFIGIQAKNRYWLISAGGWGLATLVYIPSQFAARGSDGGPKRVQRLGMPVRRCHRSRRSLNSMQARLIERCAMRAPYWRRKLLLKSHHRLHRP
jgi:hypothetical protein